MTTATGQVAAVDWPELDAAFDWRQGEHVSLIGPTGQGKTTLATHLLERRAHVVGLITKPRDETSQKLIRHAGYKRIYTWPPPATWPNTRHRFLLWPKYRTPADIPNLGYQIGNALDEMFAEGSWCVFADELFYLHKKLKLQPILEDFWTQGRSLGLSLIGGVQRPAHVSLMAYDQATHLFFWRDNDVENLRRIGGLGAHDSKAIRTEVAHLARHEVLYVNTRTGALARFMPPALPYGVKA